MISPSIHRELARQKQADLLREADVARLAAKVDRNRNHVPTNITFAKPVEMLKALSFLGLAGRRPQPA